MLNFHKIKIEYWKVIEGDSFQRVRRAKRAEECAVWLQKQGLSRDSGLRMGMVKVGKVY